ncbi:MAG: hypothetical protein HY910_18415 [Desulfarculus sp.]|nr:hypothetical protein [Desulfarculus sp.]
MPDNPTQQLLQQLVNSSLRVQWLSIKAQWEPALIQALAPMADDCLAILRRELAALASDPTTPPDWPALTARLASACAQVVSTRGNAAKALLLAMTREVVEETAHILTLNGLAGPVPAPHAPGQDLRVALEALAGGPVVDEYVKKGFVEFGAQVTAQLKRARAGQLSPEALYQACQPAAKRWRLTILARTLAHEVFNRARRAVCAQLP